MRSRGIVLIASLITILLVLMVVGAAVLLGLSSSARSGDVRAQSQALAAAEAGIAYAQSRLQTAVPGWDWAGGSGGPTQTVSLGNLSVVEDRGNVVGIIKTGDGSVSSFLIRFNPQNGTDDPDGSHWIYNPYLSVNNLKRLGFAPVFLANGGNDFAATTVANFECPPQQICLFVEGRAGDGLRGATPDNPYPETGNQRVVSRVIECHLKKKNSANDPTPGTLFAGLGLDVQVSEDYDPGDKKAKGFTLSTVSKGSAPYVYVAGNVYASDGAGSDRTIATSLDSPEGVLTSGGSVKSSTPVNTKLVSGGMPGFPQLDWESLTTSKGTPASLKGGIYMWRDDGGGKKLYYYDESYEHYNEGKWSPPAINPADEVNDSAQMPKLGTAFTSGALATGKAGELSISNDIQVQLSANSYGSLAIVSEGTNFGNQDAKGQKFIFAKPGKGDTIFFSSSEGNTYLEGKIEGKDGASISSAGNLSIGGGGSEVNAYGYVRDTPVNLYSKGKISLKSLAEPAKGKYEDIKLAGLVYAWGDIEMDTGTSKLEVTGTVVAYGTDVNPSASSIGTAVSNGKGMIQLKGKSVSLKYKDDALAGAQSGAGSGPLVRCFWASY